MLRSLFLLSCLISTPPMVPNNSLYSITRFNADVVPQKAVNILSFRTEKLTLSAEYFKLAADNF